MYLRKEDRWGRVTALGRGLPLRRGESGRVRARVLDREEALEHALRCALAEDSLVIDDGVDARLHRAELLGLEVAHDGLQQLVGRRRLATRGERAGEERRRAKRRLELQHRRDRRLGARAPGRRRLRHKVLEQAVGVGEGRKHALGVKHGLLAREQLGDAVEARADRVEVGRRLHER